MEFGLYTHSSPPNKERQEYSLINDCHDMDRLEEKDVVPPFSDRPHYYLLNPNEIPVAHEAPRIPSPIGSTPTSLQSSGSVAAASLLFYTQPVSHQFLLSSLGRASLDSFLSSGLQVFPFPFLISIT